MRPNLLVSPKVSDLGNIHTTMGRILLKHQMAVHDKDFREAMNRYSEYEETLVGHIGLEDRIYMEAHSVSAVGLKNQLTGVFLSEHQRMLALLPVFRRLMTLWTAGKGSPHSTKALLETEINFSQLVGYHEYREEALLYPFLENEMPEDEVRFILKRFPNISLRSWEIARYD